MSDAILFALLGLGSGALIGGVALAVVLTYRGSGIINLATGATTMVGGYSFWAFRTGQIGGGMGAVPALLLTLVVSVGFGALVEFSTFRPLRRATPLAKVVASLGLLLVTQAVVILAFGSDAQSPPGVLPDSTVSLLGFDLPVDRLILAGIVIVAGVACWALYRFTSFGLATRAASESEESGVLAGLAPDRIALINTLLASLVAGGLGVLAGSLAALDATSLPLVIVPALAAALLANFTSFGVAVAASIGIGVLTSEVDYLQTLSWYPTSGGGPIPGVKDVVIFLIIGLALYLRGVRLPGRGEVLQQQMPFAPRPEKLTRTALTLSLVAVVALIVLPFDFRQALITSMIGTVLILSLVVVTGYVGQVSAIQLALSGVAGFALSHLTLDAGIGFPFGALIAIVATTLLGLVVAFSAVRVRGVNLAVVTLAGAVAIESFGFNNPDWAGGLTGGAPVPELRFLGLDLGARSAFRGLDGNLPSPVLGFVVLAVTVVLCVLVANLRCTPLGQRMLAVRANERAAAAAGVNVRSVKLAASGIGSFLAATAGVLYAYNFGTVSASRFGVVAALGVIAYAFLGGITTVSGAVIGGLMTTEAIFPHILDKWVLPQGQAGTYTLLIGGVSLILTLILNPEGIAGARYRKREAKRERVRERVRGTASSGSALPESAVVPAGGRR